MRDQAALLSADFSRFCLCSTRALQVGCSDGTVAVWRLQPDEQSSADGTVPVTPVLLSHASCDPSPLRAVAWAPPALAAAAADGLGRAVYMAAGHQGALSIWDVRCGQDTDQVIT